jgi:hypothetical protein
MSKLEPETESQFTHPTAMSSSEFLGLAAIPKGRATLAQPFKVWVAILNYISPEGTAEKLYPNPICRKTEMVPFSLFGFRICFEFRISGFEFLPEPAPL